MNISDKIVLFDGVCNLCNGFVRFIIRRDQNARISFAPIQSPFGQSLYKKFILPAENIDSVIYIVDNKHYLRSSAVLHILKELRGGWGLFYGLIIIPRFIRDFFYNLIARRRYIFFGKRETCMVPLPEIQNRFLS